METLPHQSPSHHLHLQQHLHLQKLPRSVHRSWLVSQSPAGLFRHEQWSIALQLISRPAAHFHTRRATQPRPSMTRSEPPAHLHTRCGIQLKPSHCQLRLSHARLKHSDCRPRPSHSRLCSAASLVLQAHPLQHLGPSHHRLRQQRWHLLKRPGSALHLQLLSPSPAGRSPLGRWSAVLRLVSAPPAHWNTRCETQSKPPAHLHIRCETRPKPPPCQPTPSDSQPKPSHSLPEPSHSLPKPSDSQLKHVHCHHSSAPLALQAWAPQHQNPSHHRLHQRLHPLQHQHPSHELRLRLVSPSPSERFLHSQFSTAPRPASAPLANLHTRCETQLKPVRSRQQP
mmetsp:Transcript_81922/g.145103  ORF Transcript_81922/g.145103 Transcript_81922/m.145103 type:complete len:340 (+) Transcript_81922:1724-2743(+)